IWFNSFEMIRQNQILGVGPGNFSYVYPATISSAMPDDPDWQKYQGLYTNAAHNTLLQIWAELGPIGALLLILIVAAAFGDLWRKAHGAQGARPVERWIAWAGFAALAVFCGASIMSFPLQLPSSTILFFALLPLGPMLGDPEREEGGFRMPALTLEGRVATIVFRLKNMKNLVAVEGRFDLPVWGRGVLILAGAILAAVLLFQTAQPFRADVLYNEGRLLEKQGRRDQAEVLFRKGLEIDPDHQDLRSHYSSFLLEEGRYQEVVGQMDTLFKRLNSTELYLRRAKAYQALGLTAQAQRDLEEYYRRAPFQQMLKTP
ncbi:O-antigen ligase family protein, partial [bacterium]|nr:O-antigen ligase family protein [bacterium]